MKIKAILTILPAAFLMACGGSAETSNESGETTSGDYHTSFGECSANGSSISMTSDPIDENYMSALKGSENSDWGSFTNSNAEITESHSNLYIKFTNNPDILNSSLGSYGPTDQSLTITVQNKDGELEAGEYTEDDIKVKLTLGQKSDGAATTSDIGSDKMTNAIIINDISEDHVCGSFSITTEEGQEIITATFDMDIKVVKF